MTEQAYEQHWIGCIHLHFKYEWVYNLGKVSQINQHDSLPVLNKQKKRIDTTTYQYQQNLEKF